MSLHQVSARVHTVRLGVGSEVLQIQHELREWRAHLFEFVQLVELVLYHSLVRFELETPGQRRLMTPNSTRGLLAQDVSSFELVFQVWADLQVMR